MDWIYYYVSAVSLWFLILALMLIFNKLRFFSFYLIIFSIIFFIGLKFVEKISPDMDKVYKESKRFAFIEAAKKNNETTVNILPSSWLQKLDGRKNNSIIPMNYREQIGGFFPLGSAPNLFTLYCAEDEGFISYKTDRFGFRNNDILWNYNMHDITLTGDSETESACVRKPMQDYFDKSLKTISLGKGGNGPLTSLSVMREYLDTYKTKIIYHLISDNDFSRPEKHHLKIDLDREWDEIKLQNYLNNKNYNIKYFSELDLSNLRYFAINYSKKMFLGYNSTEFELNNKIANLFSYYFIRKNLLFLINTISKKSDDKTQLIEKNKLKKVYKEMIKTSNEKNIKLKFVILPTKSYCSSSKAHKFLINVLKEIKVKPLDLTFKLCDLKYFASNGDHFNSYGYKTLSEYINSDYNLLFN